MPGSVYDNLDRPPLDQAGLRRALIVPAGGLWSRLEVRAETGSTNADVAAAARAGEPEGLVIIAERQTAGRGRLDRQWESPARAGLAFSVLLRPGAAGVPPARFGWLPLLAGVALASTVRRLGEVDAVLKWPNDLLIDGNKCAGILAEAVPDAIVIGIGLNVTLTRAELPRPDATSLALVNSACTDRDPLLRAVLRELAFWYQRWTEAGGDAEVSGLLAEYQAHCATIGRAVRVALPGDAELIGTASDVDSAGRLLVAGADGQLIPVAAGDVVHVR